MYKLRIHIKTGELYISKYPKTEFSYYSSYITKSLYYV